MTNLIKKFQNISHQYDLWKKGDKIVVACSGGPDSVCLLDVFAKLSPKYNLKLIVAHVNYGLRGRDSDGDEKFVRNLAEKYGVRFSPLTLNPSPKGRGGFKKTISPSGRELERRENKYPSEEILREIRYDFFEKIRRKNKFDFITVGHTLDDQAETFLMRIIRGAGLAGMAAMRHKNNKIIRPLLGVTKKEILKYLKDNKLRYKIDKTNKEIPFLRNKIRNELIPLLEKKYNPNIKKVLHDSSLTIADDYDLINNLAGIYEVSGTLSAKKLLQLHPALQKRIILETVRKKKKGLKDIESAHVSEIMKVVKSTKNKRQIVKFKRLKITKKGDKIKITNLITNN